MPEELIAITHLADELGRHKSFLFKLVDRFNITKQMQRSGSARGQKIAFISQADANQIREYIAHSDEVSDVRPSATFENTTAGFFYLVQLEPEHDPGRFKLGFATNLEERLRAHKTAAPYSSVVKAWPCKFLWEKVAIESVTQGCEQIHTEVFRYDSIEEIARRCDQFFSLMPSPENAT